MSAHTPGPWTYHFGAGLVVTARPNGDIPLNSRVVAKVTEASESDIRLIAAAPELLEALELAASQLDELSEEFGLHNVITKARAAIAKARGESK